MEFHFTELNEGKKISRYENIKSKDIIIYDRAYGTISGMEYVITKGAAFLFLLRAKAFNLYTKEKTVFDLTAFLEENYEAGQMIDLKLFYKSGKEYYPVRICAVGKTEVDIEKTHKHTKKSNSKKKRGNITNLQKIYGQYMITATSLTQDISTKQILDLYRM